MTAPFEFDRLLESVIEDGGPHGAPEATVEAALATAAVVRQRRPIVSIVDPLAWPRAIGSRSLILLVGLLILMLSVALAAGAGGGPFRRDPFGVVDPTSSPSASLEPLSAAPLGSITADLRQTWVADQPDDLSFDGESGPRRWSLAFGADGESASVVVGAVPRMPSTVQAATSATLEFTTTRSASSLIQGGVSLGGCTPGDLGRYTWSLSADGSLLSLDSIGDACSSRQAVLGRAWTRDLTGDSLGGRGVVEAFEPLFLATLPTGPYATTRSSDAIEIWAADQGVALLAFKDPQGFVDPCDVAGGRYEIALGRDAVEAYFRQNPGFEVISADSLMVGGHPATHLVVEGRSGSTCPSGWSVEWQPKAETSDHSWHLGPGQRDSLFIVELPSTTVMFQVLEAPSDVESAVISSIEFVDRIPPEPSP